MIVVPNIYAYIIYALGLDPIWFATLLMINITTGLISPPVGVNLFAMKMVATLLKPQWMKSIEPLSPYSLLSQRVSYRISYGFPPNRFMAPRAHEVIRFK